ncbi:MAG TPA: family 10 glycosylhydrolase [Vicinamibacterales bacterium]|nr:family 10 glycosylhydrolase [Vicinamibacterales bacterium]
MLRASRFILTSAVLLVSLPFAQSSVVGARGPREETRALWVERTALLSPNAITAMVNAAKGGGFNTIFVQVRALGEAFYDSAIDPRATSLDAQPASFDPLATAIETGHRAGLQVHAWINVNFVASAATLPRSRSHVVFRHPEWLMVPNALAASLRNIDPQSPEYVAALARWTRGQSASVEGLYLSPATEQAQDYTTSVVTEIATKYAVDGIHLDYLRFPTDAFDYSRATLAAFRLQHAAAAPAAERQRLDARAVNEPAVWTAFLPEGWTTYRRDRLTTLATRLVSSVRKARPQALLSVAVGKSADEAAAYRFQDWRSWGAAETFDALCPMIYTEDAQEFADLLAKARPAAGPTPLWVGVGAYKLPVAGTADRLKAIRRAGAAGFVLFSYDNLTNAPGRPSDYLAALRPFLVEPPAGDGLLR